MSTIFDDDILIHHIGVPGLPGDGFTAPEASALRTDVNEILARPNIAGLDDIPDVNAAAPGDGESLIYNSATGKWDTGVSTGSINTVRQTWGDTTTVSAVNDLAIDAGLQVSPSGVGTAILSVRLGGTGSSYLVARQDHTHVIFADRPFPFVASGTLSGGTRTLVSGNVTGLDSDRSYILKGTLYLHQRGDGTGASFTRPRLTINGVGVDVFEDSRAVAGVLVTEVVHHPGVGISGVTSVAVSATVSFQPGDPAYIGGGVLFIEIEANR